VRIEGWQVKAETRAAVAGRPPRDGLTCACDWLAASGEAA